MNWTESKNEKPNHFNRILTFNGMFVQEGYWSFVENRFVIPQNDDGTEITHWMDLPSAPRINENGIGFSNVNPPKPISPMSRIINETRQVDICGICNSSIVRTFPVFGRKYCINEKCINHFKL